jgi:hypothetical protein
LVTVNVPLSVNVQLKVTYVPCIDVTFAFESVVTV